MSNKPRYQWAMCSGPNLEAAMNSIMNAAGVLIAEGYIPNGPPSLLPEKDRVLVLQTFYLPVPQLVH